MNFTIKNKAELYFERNNKSKSHQFFVKKVAI